MKNNILKSMYVSKTVDAPKYNSNNSNATDANLNKQSRNVVMNTVMGNELLKK